MRQENVRTENIENESGYSAPAGDPTKSAAPGQGDIRDMAEENSQSSGNGKESEQQSEVQRLQMERDQLLDRLARLQADFDNHRKREARERSDFRDYALVNTVEQFLPVLDNFQLALRSQGTTEQLRSGVDLIVRQMEEILRSIGVQPIPSVEARFDPRLHEAIEMVERDDMPDQQVMEEVRRGYTLRDRLLRPALVRVANNPKQKTA